MNAFPNRTLLAAFLVLVSGACGAEDRAVQRAEASAAVVDSLLPLEEELRRFREGLEVPRGLSGAPSREALVRGFATALFSADTAALASMLMTRAEFAYLYYPTSMYAREPYDLSPALVWFQFQTGTDKGITRALRRLSGRGLVYEGFECEREAKAEGENRLWEGCIVRYADASGTRYSDPMFGSILGRDGRFRFVSYVNRY